MSNSAAQVQEMERGVSHRGGCNASIPRHMARKIPLNWRPGVGTADHLEGTGSRSRWNWVHATV